MGDKTSMSNYRDFRNSLKSDCDEIFKILLIGDSGVGKSALIQRFSDREFTDKYTSTIGVDFRVRTIKLNGKLIKLQIWDTSGQERFRAITTNYYRNIHGVLVVFDVTQQKTFDSIPQWLEEIKMNSNVKVTKLLLGNKSDLGGQRVIDDQCAMEFASDLGISYLETSAKDSVNVEEAFVTMAAEIMENEELLTSTNENRNVKVMKNKNTQTSKKKGCC